MIIKKTVSMLLMTSIFLLTSNPLQIAATGTQLSTEELNHLAATNVLNELGISDLDEYIDNHFEHGNRNEEYDPADFVDICSTGSSYGKIDAMDASYLTSVLNGAVNYPYDYNDLDATGDKVINIADAFEYLDCYLYNTVMGNDPNFTPSTHGATRTVNPLLETRRYIKHNYINIPFILCS